MIIAAIGSLDAGVRQGVACYAEREAKCPMAFPFRSVLLLQLLAALACLWLIYRIAMELCASEEVAYLTVLLVALGGKFGEYAGHMQAYGFVGLAVFASLYSVVRAHRQSSLIWACLAGLMLGLGALFHPPLLYLLLLFAPVLGLVGFAGQPASKPRALMAAGLMLLGGLVVALPWLLRNHALFGGMTLGEDYEGLPLGQRMAFNAMTWKEWASAFVVWLPGIGDGLAAQLFSETTASRVGSVRPGSYYAKGVEYFIEAQTEAARSGRGVLGILSGRLLGEHPRHLMASLPLAVRGVWGSSIPLILIAPLFLWRLWRIAGNTGQRPAITLVASFAVLLLLVHAVLTPNPYWLNVQMLFLWSYAIAYVAGGL